MLLHVFRQDGPIIIAFAIVFYQFNPFLCSDQLEAYDGL